MATQLTQGAALSAPTFDPAAWLSAPTSIDGGYALAFRRKPSSRGCGRVAC